MRAALLALMLTFATQADAWFDIFVSSPYFDRPKTIILPLAEGKICKRSARKLSKEHARLVRAENFRTFRANELLRGS